MVGGVMVGAKAAWPVIAAFFKRAVVAFRLYSFGDPLLDKIFGNGAHHQYWCGIDVEAITKSVFELVKMLSPPP
uniref:Uncharacterized protein n=1 Tax=Ditylenchus dipsaci TaxID=166011 RepID=A0A915D0B7_9BILA